MEIVVTETSTDASGNRKGSEPTAGKWRRGPDLAPTRWTLIERLKNWGDEKSWREFFDTYWQLIYSVALKAGLTETEAQEAVQETVIAVARKMPQFRADPQAGSFKGFLLQITGRRITDQFRRRARLLGPAPYSGPRPNRSGDRDDGDRTSTVDRIPDPAGLQLEALWDQEWREQVVEMAMARLRQRLDPEQYQMFELYILQGQTVREVAQKLAVSRAQVYFAKYKVAKLLKREIGLLKEALR
jgi:RNA polymerase sigma factor (sigma-70 family)